MVNRGSDKPYRQWLYILLAASTVFRLFYIQWIDLAPDEAYYWATHNGAELDLFLLKDGQRIGVECKRVDGPRLTPSMRTALEDLELDRLFVIYPGPHSYPMAEKVQALPLSDLGKKGGKMNDEWGRRE